MSDNSILIEEYCSYYSIEADFIHQLHQHGLLTIETDGQQRFLPFEQLPVVEKYMHFYYDLDINMAGIEAIQHLLNRVQDLNQQLQMLQNGFVTSL